MRTPMIVASSVMRLPPGSLSKVSRLTPRSLLITPPSLQVKSQLSKRQRRMLQVVWMLSATWNKMWGCSESSWRNILTTRSTRSITTGTTSVLGDKPSSSTPNWAPSKFLLSFTWETKKFFSSWFTTPTMNQSSATQKHVCNTCLWPTLSKTSLVNTSTNKISRHFSAQRQSNTFGKMPTWSRKSSKNGIRLSCLILEMNVTNCTTIWQWSKRVVDGKSSQQTDLPDVTPYFCDYFKNIIYT